MSEHMIPLSVDAKALLEQATSEYSLAILESPKALQYLYDRGLEMPTIWDFRLGVVTDPIIPEHNRFRGMICIPNLGGSADQHPVGLKFRSIDPDTKKKYDSPHGQVARLFNLRTLSHAGNDDTIYITEGEFDTIALGSVGLPAVAVPGVTHWTKGNAFRARLFDGYRVVLCRDSDDAALQLVGPMEKSLDDLIVRGFEPHKDVNEFLIHEGPEALLLRATEGK